MYGAKIASPTLSAIALSAIALSAITLSAITCATPARAVIDHPEKIGIGALNRTAIGPALDRIGFPFYYTWSTQPVPDADGTAFIPMVAAADKVHFTVPKASGFLLGFNEPFRPDQYLSPDRAIELWPLLMAHGLRLGSPATSPGPSSLGRNSWLAQFLAKADARNYRVDFVAVHYYSADGDVEKFRYFLEQVHDAYRKPIWVTEWALHDHGNKAHVFTSAQKVEFAERGVEMLDNLAFVERHMWFKTHYRGPGDLTTHILDGSNALNAVGEVFYDALRGADFGHETIVVPANLVPNPSFEDAEDAQWEQYWRINMGQGAVVTGAGTAHTGTGSLRLGAGAAQASNDITYRTKPGSSYEVSAWAKLGSAGEKASIGIKSFNETGAVVGNVTVPVTSTAFNRVEASLTIPASATRVIVNLYKNPGTSIVTIDDVSVVEK